MIDHCFGFIRCTLLLLFVFGLLFIRNSLFAQCKTEVRSADETFLNAAWTGGLNACQFGQMDLNNDGKKDLVVFDRHGNRLLTFVNIGNVGEINYQYDDQYEKYFPAVDDWIIFADYDGDGKEDIFTYSKGWAGIKVAHNVSGNQLAFEWVKKPYLTSWQGGGEVNILATNADYPALVDLDNDGDLDILTFWALGTFIEKHTNLSVEKYGTTDSLVFEKTDFCWGYVAESEENNVMYLDTCLFGKSIMLDREEQRHRGATFAIRDLNGDGMLDMLLGDVDYPGLTFLENGSGNDHPSMLSQSENFPPSYPVHLYSMPVTFFADINNDGIKDLLVSPFDPNPMVCEGNFSIWLYLNEGTDQLPDFQLYAKDFLQNQMIDVGTGAFPVFEDVNHDGLLDLLVANIGDIDSAYYQLGVLSVKRSSALTYFENVGTAQQPSYKLVNLDFGSLKSFHNMGMVPAFADLNFDGFNEMLVGTAEGNLMLFDSDYVLIDSDFLHFDQQWSVPFFSDVNEDGVTDLVVGQKNGRLSLFLGSMLDETLSFDLKTQFWGGVDVRDYDVSYYGYSVPFLFRLGDKLFLAVGSEQGKIFLFDNLENNIEGDFTDVTETWPDILEFDFDNAFGYRSSVAVIDLDQDGHLELCAGNFSGGLQLLNHEIPVSPNVVENDDDVVMLSPNPVSSVLHVKADRSFQMVEIRDLLGNLFLSQEVNQSVFDINVESLNDGLYFITLVSKSQRVQLRFMKL